MSALEVCIERIRAHEVVVPLRPGHGSSPELGTFLLRSSQPGGDWDSLPICLLEVDCSDGVTALGEVGRGVSLESISPAIQRLIGAPMRPGAQPLVEQESTGAVELLEAFPAAFIDRSSAVDAALEIARLDWAGKRLGRPAVEILGGPYRESIAVDYWCGRQTPADLRATVARARDLGFTGLKMKSRRGDPTLDQVKAVRSAGGPGFGLTIDPMGQWVTPHDALGMIHSLAPYAEGLRIEDPFPQDQPELWHRMRHVSPVTVVWHARGQASLRRALQERCADAYNCSGTPSDFAVCAHAVELAGLPCWRGSALELGVAQAAGLHSAAAARACVLASDFQSALVREHTLVDWSWPYTGGHIPLPPGPGIGVSLDEDAVAKYRRAVKEFS